MDKQKIMIKSEFIRLDQLLKWAGFVGSGSEAKFIIDAGKIFVNEEVELRRGRKIYPGDLIKNLDQEGLVFEIVLEGKTV